MTAFRIFHGAQRAAHRPGRILPIDPREQQVLDELRRRRKAAEQKATVK